MNKRFILFFFSVAFTLNAIAADSMPTQKIQALIIEAASKRIIGEICYVYDHVLNAEMKYREEEPTENIVQIQEQQKMLHQTLNELNELKKNANQNCTDCQSKINTIENFTLPNHKEIIANLQSKIDRLQERRKERRGYVSYYFANRIRFGKMTPAEKDGVIDYLLTPDGVKFLEQYILNLHHEATTGETKRVIQTQGEASKWICLDGEWVRGNEWVARDCIDRLVDLQGTRESGSEACFKLIEGPTAKEKPCRANITPTSSVAQAVKINCKKPKPPEPVKRKK